MTERELSTMVTDPADIDPCPGCGATGDAQPITGISPRAVNPQPNLDRLAAAIEQFGAPRSILRQVIALADDAATLSNKEMRERVLALADRARLVNPQRRV